MQAAQRSWYLQRLGIAQWQERALAPAVESDMVAPASAAFAPAELPVANRLPVSGAPELVEAEPVPALVAPRPRTGQLQPTATAPVPVPATTAPAAEPATNSSGLRVLRLRGEPKAGVLVLLPPGKSGDAVLLDAMLASVGLNAGKLQIAVLARSGEPAEPVSAPVILALGQLAASAALGRVLGLAQARGRVHADGPQRIVVTYHPDELRKNPALKRLAWQDLKLLATVLTAKAPVEPPLVP